jgi:cobalt-zinc-cadmium resistance protein CzcA
LLLFASPNLFAQNTPTGNRITFNQAYDTAIRNNLQLRSNDLQIERSRTLANTWLAFPRTGVFAENEDINPQDKQGILKIGVSQTLEWPGLYKAQRALLQQQVGSAEASRRIRELEIRRDVQAAYYQTWYLQSKQQLWQRLDSLYASFAQAAVLRVRTGESAGLDSISARAKAGEISVQLSILQRDIQTQQEILKRFLNTSLYYLPPLQPLEKVEALFVTDSVQTHPILRLQQQNIAIAEAQVNVQQQSNKPNFDSRFFSQRLYGISNPYSGFSVTVGIPLFGRSSFRNNIRAAQIERAHQQTLYDYERLALNTAYSQAFQQLQKDRELLTFYETTGGEIGFADLSQFLTQAIDIQKNYLDVLNQYNQSAIQLNYYLNR